MFLLIYTFRGRKSAKSSIDLPAGQNVQFPSLLQLKRMIFSIFSRNYIISIACYLHGKNISLFTATQTSQAPGNLTGGSCSYQVSSSPSSLWSTGPLSQERTLTESGPYISPAHKTGDLLLEIILLENRRVQNCSILSPHSLPCGERAPASVSLSSRVPTLLSQRLNSFRDTLTKPKCNSQ